MARLVRDHSAGAYAVSVSCIKGDGMVRLSDAVMDLDGPAFEAYYHEKCKPEGDVNACPTWDCARPECLGAR